jgi:Ion channel
MELVPMNDTMARLRDRWSDPLLTALTGLLLVMLFVVAPLQALGIFVFQAFELVLAIVLVVGVFAVSGSRTAVVAMLVALAMITVGATLRLGSPSILDLNLFAGSWLIMGITLGWVVARATFAGGRVTYHRIMGAVLLYLTIAVVFAALFTFIGTLVPTAYSGMAVQDSPALASQLIYFSFATLTTTGYGDIHPVHPLARSLCNLEAIFGQLYPATLLARLVTLETAHRSGSSD